jgi:hypothetical protein
MLSKAREEEGTIRKTGNPETAFIIIAKLLDVAVNS